MPDTLPHEFRTVADRLLRDLPGVLGRNLVGIYVYGSAVDESFIPGRSDFDCLVVTEGRIGDSEFSTLGDWLVTESRQTPEFDRTQISFLVRERVLEDDPSACLYQFGRLTRSGSDGNPIVWLDFLRRGLVLHGPHPSSFLPEIGSELLHEALVRELGYLREELVEKAQSEWRDRNSYRAYSVLTLCRILYSAATGDVASKTRAAEWAVAELKDESSYRELIRVADEVSREKSTATIPLSPIGQFIGYVSRRIGA